jgi:hypothetical protein
MSAVSEVATGLKVRKPQIASGYPHRNSLMPVFPQLEVPTLLDRMSKPKADACDKPI